MNPYIATGLAMCAVILIALIGTGYLAVYFTRRAKQDVELMLTPLAELTNGKADVEEAEVEGTWNGTIVQGRMARAAAGTVTLWQSDLIDSAGGAEWNYVYSRPNPKKKNPEEEIDIVTDSAPVRAWLETWTLSDLEPIGPLETDWIQVEYSPERGGIRIARPIRGRNEIPSAESFRRDLDFAERTGAQNRTIQEQNSAEVRE